MKKPHKDRIALYSPSADIRTPKILFAAMFRDVLESRELAWRLFIRDIAARYRQSYLGIFWAFIPAILSGMVFVILEAKKIVNLPPVTVPYPVFVMTGSILWSVFSDSIMAPLRSVQSARSMLAKINFPREALLISAFYDQIFSTSIKLVVLVAIFIILGFPLHLSMLLAIPAILMLMMMGMTIGLLLTPGGMLYSDVASGLTTVLQLWFFVTPVVYPPPQTFPYSMIATLNPVSPLLVGARDLLLHGGFNDPFHFFVISGFTLIFLILAWILFRVSMPIIIERVSS
jgi:lipopolysaccharide transport system permease protein